MYTSGHVAHAVTATIAYNNSLRLWTLLIDHRCVPCKQFTYTQTERGLRDFNTLGDFTFPQKSCSFKPNFGLKPN